MRRVLGWRAVETGDEQTLLSDVQRRELARRKEEAQNGLPEAVRATYSVLLAVNEGGAVEAKALPSGQGTPFERIKALLVENERLLVGTLDPELLLPGSYVALWGAQDTSKRVRDLMSAFAQLPRLPRLIRPGALLNSLARGVREGQIVLRLLRPDGSAQTWWRNEPDTETLARAEMEVMPVQAAELASLTPDLLAPGRLDGLWPATGDPVRFADAYAFFDGQRAPRLAGESVLADAVRAAVQRGLVMARLGETSYLREDLPADVTLSGLTVLEPPPPVRGAELAPSALPEAWHDDTATAADLWAAISGRRGYRVPWALFRDALNEALGTRTLELAPGTAPWPAGAAAASAVTLRAVSAPGPVTYGPRLEPTALVDDTIQAAWANGPLTLRVLKEALEAAHGQEIGDEAFQQAVRSALDRGIIVAAGGVGGAATLDTRVRLSDVALFTEAQLTARELQDFAGIVQHLIRAAPELSLTFRVSVIAEGAKPAPDVIAALNDLLARASRKLRLE